jgi:hypothetical protein
MLALSDNVANLGKQSGTILPFREEAENFQESFRIMLTKFVHSYYRWYFGKIKRIEAEKKLLLPENEHGAFLIRDSESRRNDYSLSVRDGDTVKHYRIRQLDDGKR